MYPKCSFGVSAECNPWKWDLSWMGYFGKDIDMLHTYTLFYFFDKNNQAHKMKGPRYKQNNAASFLRKRTMIAKLLPLCTLSKTGMFM